MSKNLFHISRLVPCALCLVSFLSSCENDEEVIKEWTRDKVMMEEAKNVESYLSQNGLVKAKLTAPIMLRALAIDTPYLEFPNTLHCDFYDDSSKLETWLDSKYGKYFENQNKVYLRDSVIVITVKGDTLRSPDLWWDQNKKIFYTDKYATYHGPNKLINGGKGMQATQDLSSVIFNDVTGNLKVSESGGF